MAQQTAVEWLMSEMLKPDMYKIWVSLLERAKAMEKQQIIDAATWGFLADTGEQYYKERYGTKDL